MKSSVKKHSRSLEEKLYKTSATRPVIIAVMICVGAYIVLPSLTANPNLYEGNKDKSYLDAQNILKTVKLPGTIVYNNVRDRGCDNRSAGYFQINYHCELFAQKYSIVKVIKNELQTIPTTVMSNTDESLRTLGFIPNSDNKMIANNGQLDPQFRYVIKSLKHISEATLDYTTAGRPAWSILGMLDHEIAAPHRDEFIVGFSFEITYMSCSNGSILQQVCPPPKPLLIP